MSRATNDFSFGSEFSRTQAGVAVLAEDNEGDGVFKREARTAMTLKVPEAIE